MSATQFAPSEMEVIDDGTAPMFFIDGLASHEMKEGIMRVSLCINQSTHRLVVVRLFYTLDTFIAMRRQFGNHIGEDVHPSDILGSHH